MWNITIHGLITSHMLLKVTFFPLLVVMKIFHINNFECTKKLAQIRLQKLFISSAKQIGQIHWHLRKTNT